MATTCNFGPIKDLRVRELCILGKVVIDRNRNVKCLNFTSEKQETRGILPVSSSEGVVIDSPLFQDRTGISRIYLDSEIVIKDLDGNVLLDPANFFTSFETQGPPAALALPDHHYVVPSLGDYTNECLEDWCVYIEVNAQILVESEEADGASYSVQIRRNGSEIVSEAVAISGAPSEDSKLETITITDIIKCNPGDTLDFYVDNAARDVPDTDLDLFIRAGTEATHATFKVITFERA